MSEGDKNNRVLLSMVALAAVLVLFLLFGRGDDDPSRSDPSTQTIAGEEERGAARTQGDSPSATPALPSDGRTTGSRQAASDAGSGALSGGTPPRPGDTRYDSGPSRYDEYLRNTGAPIPEHEMIELRKGGSFDVSDAERAKLRDGRSATISQAEMEILRANANPQIPEDQRAVVEANAGSKPPQNLVWELESGRDVRLPTDIQRDFEDPYPTIPADELEVMRRNADPVE